ncbi:MAG: DUF4412 domain-containing protein [Saprospiraceae bacterium]|nr:DUF4412 domain-containing protein [Saprospiraceae bacterium]
MKTIKFILQVSCIFLILPLSSDAQIFKRIQKEAQKKLMKQVEDKVVEEVSNAIVRAAYKPIDESFDRMVKNYYDSDTLENGEIDWEKVNRNYGEMMDSFDASEKLPESYVFDLYLDIQLTDYGKETRDCRMYYKKDGTLFGIEQKEYDATSLVVMDIENDLMAMYRTEEGKKSVYAIPNMIRMYQASNNKGLNDNVASLELNKTGKTKDIAGYYCENYKGENEDENLNVYLAPDFPVDWKDSYGGFLNQFTPGNYSDSVNKMKGMIMYSESRLKEDDKKYSLWEVRKVHEKSFVLDNNDFEKESYKDH